MEEESQLIQAITTVRKRGAPKGNQNACRHGYYSKVNDAEQRAALVRLPPLAQIDAKIEWVTARGRAVYRRDPLNTRVLRIAANRVIKLRKSRAYIERLQRDPAFRTEVSDAFLEDGIAVDLSWITAGQPETADRSNTCANSVGKAAKSSTTYARTLGAAQAQYVPENGDKKDANREITKNNSDSGTEGPPVSPLAGTED